MSILSNIFSKIFPSSHTANSSGSAAPSVVAGAAPAAAPGMGATAAASSTPVPAQPSPTPTASPAPAAPAAPAPMAEVDVEKTLDDLAAKSPEKLNWKTSIIDLMKLLNLDSSLENRKELAKELNYGGSTSDSAAMNVWLHREVMNKIAANGGKVPAQLKD